MCTTLNLEVRKKGERERERECVVLGHSKEIFIHLVRDARLEVAQEGVGFAVLQLPELHRLTTQEVVQLSGKDGCRAALVLRALVTWKEVTVA